uniref:Exportin-1 n=2 Tax=Vannella robusta TaxID=1487602 RepID=A0A7S4MSJ1_9EUKA|mmetsp:Transcript_9056/g.11198  ORF Transcript_9056/g.11198 Transcript_9056/m.11198 type:complete len:704 (+) Transcript_9056:1054-3165(+)
MVDDDEIFKICLEYWNTLSSDLFHNDHSRMNSMCGDSKVLMFNQSSNERLSPRLQLYAPVLDQVRVAVISKMAKPEEVLIVEDENGELIQEEFPDTDEIIMYNNMRDTLVYLTHLNPDSTTQIMKEGLNRQVSSADWTWAKLNTICWAIGSISGALLEEVEKRFLVYVIKELLTMCENTRGKENKAVIASNIMYIVGQYPRFLQAHWKFLCTVINKLFEFMHETFPGVREMACETFLKISKSCRSQFAINREKDTQPFLVEVINDIPNKTRDLEPPQVQTFYESLGYMIQANPPQFHQQLVERFMQLPNAKWRDIIAHASQNMAYLQEQTTAKAIVSILRVNVRVAISLGPAFKYQLGPLFMEILHIYRAYSETISNIIAENGPQVAKYAKVRSYRAVKRETLRVFSAFISNTDDRQLLLQEFVPLLLEAVLGDYQSNIPDARDPEVLSLMTAIVTKLRGDMIKEIPRIFSCVFECTVQMIQTNFEDFPEHRINFFNLLRAINSYCFQAFFIIPPNIFKLTIDSIVWAFKHTMRNIADTGLIILRDLWLNIQSSEAAVSFYKTYLLSLLKDIFAALTDTLHKSSFPLHAAILMLIIQSVKNGSVNVPLWDTSSQNFQNNQEFLHAFIVNLIGSAFSNLSSAQVQAFATGLFTCDDISAFKVHLRDFLVQMKEFGGDNSELYVEEQEAQQQKLQEQRSQIPGLK